MQFPCNEIAMSCQTASRSRIWHRLFQKLFIPTTYPWRYIYFWWSWVCTALETVGRAPVLVWERCKLEVSQDRQIQVPVAQERRVLWRPDLHQMKAPSLYVQTIATSWGWQPHQIWSYGPLKSTIFHGFGSRGWIRAGISPEPYKLWTWDLHHWIQQRLRFKRVCRNIVTTPSDLELWTREISYVSRIWFMWSIRAGISISRKPYKL